MEKPQFIFKDLSLAIKEAQNQRNQGKVKVKVRHDETTNEYGVYVFPGA